MLVTISKETQELNIVALVFKDMKKPNCLIFHMVRGGGLDTYLGA